ncbi:MAG: 3'-5' exonuclease [Nannocystaceae bacterium]
MLDLETFSTAANAVIVAIGAVFFEPAVGGEPVLGKEFYCRVSPENQQGAHLCPATVQWWLRQSRDACWEVDGSKPMSTIDKALMDFGDWCNAGDRFRLWGNGANFDNVVLRNAYKRTGWPAPGSHRSDMCFRTLRALCPGVERDVPVMAHHALSDAIAQAKTASRILAALACA